MYFVAIFIAFFSMTSFGTTQKPKLADYKKNIFSQFGEDGIIEKIFEIIGTTSKVVIEFGAYEGFSFSNTANLWTKDVAWKGILIEADEGLFKQLVKNVASYNCVPIHCTVGINNNDCLETILKAYGLNAHIDLLSIDIDGDDYHIFKGLKELRPRIIICEYNPSIPAHFDLHSKYGGKTGCSVAALQRIAAEKHYSLVAITDTNCFFVCDEELSKFNDYDIDREHIRIDRYIAYIISDYESCYKVIATPDFRDPWGWGGRPSMQKFIGTFNDVPAIIKR